MTTTAPQAATTDRLSALEAHVEQLAANVTETQELIDAFLDFKETSGLTEQQLEWWLAGYLLGLREQPPTEAAA